MSLPSKYAILTEPSCESQPRHMAYYDFGDVENPDVIVCVHGLSRNGLDFERLANALMPRYRVICPDIAGRGNSTWLVNKSDYSYATYLSDIIALLTQLNLPRVDWIGTSMGGIIGMMLAASQPAKVKRLILNDVGQTVSATGLKRILGYVGTSAIFADKEEVQTYLKTTLAPFGITSESQWDYMFNASVKPLPGGRYTLRYDPDISKPFREALAKDDTVNDIDLSAFWKIIKCPALILRGSVSDILTAQTAHLMCAERQEAKLVEFEGIGHAPALIDDFQIRTITDWLDIKT